MVWFDKFWQANVRHPGSSAIFIPEKPLGIVFQSAKRFPVDPIVHEIPFSISNDQIGIPEHPEVLRHCRRSDTKSFSKSINAERSVLQQFDHFYPRFNRKRLEQLCQLAGFCHVPPILIKYMRR